VPSATLRRPDVIEALPAHVPPFPLVRLLDMNLAQTSNSEVLDHVFARLAARRGGWIVTVNLDFLRRHHLDAQARALYDAADLRVADGMPVCWAARLQGDHLPERIAGASLVPLLAERAAAEGRSLYLLGGDPEVNEKAAEVMVERWPGLRVCGRTSPQISDPPTQEQIAKITQTLSRSRPDILLVGMGSPKQERVIQALRPTLPATWMIGVGNSFSFVAGNVRRAPLWMQQTGLEWLHRLAQEPRRLARRYLVDDLPVALQLFCHSALRRWR
jgi:N-acetylglucosaminyldiphosphoundecaprenol N-acetyl-beta-D-mannosaminyltransferase